MREWLLDIKSPYTQYLLSLHWQTASLLACIQQPLEITPWKPPSSTLKFPWWPAHHDEPTGYHIPPCSLGISSCPVLTAPLSHHRYIHTRGSCPVFLWAWSSLLPGLHVAGDPHYLALSSFRFSSDVSPDLHNSSSTHAGGHFLPHFSAYFLRKTSNYPKVYFILNLFFSSLPVSLAYNICKLQTNLHDARRRYCWPLSYSVQCLIRTRPSLNVLWDDWLWVHEINNLKMQFTRRRLPYQMLIWTYGSRLNNKVKRQMLSAKSEIALLKCIC